jgi:glycosyltransferase involved in cell wall biosynthesis
MKEKPAAREDTRRSQMKIVLLVLSGEANRARHALLKSYPHAETAEIPRARLESGGMTERLSALRALRPDIFAVATERLAWQRGQNAFLLFGALAGARRTIILDAHGAQREEMRARSLIVSPARLAREAAISAAAIRRGGQQLRRLELAIKRGEHLRTSPQQNLETDAPTITYLRATPGPGTQMGGAASHINGFINAALELGARISLVSNDQIAGLDEKRTPLKIIWPKPIGSTRAAFDIYNNLRFTHDAVQLIQDQQPDFIYQRYSRFSWAGVAASLRTGRPLFLEYNGSEVWVGRYWDRVGMLGLLERYERLNLAAAARVFVVSEVERQNLLRARVDDEKIVVNPNGVDAERFQPHIGGERVRRELGIEGDETLVGFVGTFGPWHGVLALAEAIKLIPKDARVRFLLVGSGALRSEVERILREANVERRVIMTGAVEHERVPALLDACDVLASPHVPLEDGSEFFGSPTKLFEYMAMGKGIVASRLGQIGEVLADEKTALLVEPGNARELSEAVMRLVNSQQLRERLGAAARREAIAKHTWTHNARRVLDAYRKSKR